MIPVSGVDIMLLLPPFVSPLPFLAGCYLACVQDIIKIYGIICGFFVLNNINFKFLIKIYDAYYIFVKKIFTRIFIIQLFRLKIYYG